MNTIGDDPIDRPFWTLALAPAALGFACVARARGGLYDAGVLPSFEAPVPVVSVGNVTAGGTGKTPIVERVASGLLARGRRPAIVSRGYGGRERGPVRVSGEASALDSPARFGDEPTWLARRMPQVGVFVGRDRVEAARFAAAQASCGVIVADDAFQHRRLRRSFDIVVVDATEPLWHYLPLPLGRAREPIGALNRAHAVIINKVNLVSRERLSLLRKMLASAAPAVSERARECEYAVRTVVDVDGRESPALSLKDVRVFCATGLGRPAAFRKTLKQSLECEIAGWLDFADHRAFTEADFEAIESAAEAAGADVIFVSEKDDTKMAQWRPKIPRFVTRLSASLLGGWEDLHDEINRSLR